MKEVHKREAKELKGGLGGLEECRKKGKGVPVNEVYGMRVRRASAGRDLGKHQISTALGRENTSNVQIRTPVLFKHLDSECTLLSYNFLS